QFGVNLGYVCLRSVYDTNRKANSQKKGAVKIYDVMICTVLDTEGRNNVGALPTEDHGDTQPSVGAIAHG
ncbi:hypothetical protein KAR48_12805, partial [bacterium]|nr:hypothetical protein [bacterium]